MEASRHHWGRGLDSALWSSMWMTLGHHTVVVRIKMMQRKPCSYLERFRTVVLKLLTPPWTPWKLLSILADHFINFLPAVTLLMYCASCCMIFTWHITDNLNEACRQLVVHRPQFGNPCLRGKVRYKSNIQSNPPVSLYWAYNNKNDRSLPL